MDTRSAIVFIVEDDAALGRFYQTALVAAGLNVRPLQSAQEFLRIYSPEQPGCLLLDVQLPDLSGLDLQRRLNQQGATIPVLFVSGHGNIAMAVQAMREGAFGFLEKPVAHQVLVQQVQEALAMDAQLRGAVRAQADTAERLRSLTVRERDVLARLMDGSSNKVIANELRLSQRTVELHRARIMKKMGSRSTAQLVRMAIDAGFTPPEPGSRE
jgi:two-component system, LuxR family, response regulator FixJ